ncbi:YigZ family protein [Alkalicoccobacillus gibsonii]|uniref:YigZ family protein n=1 Tax=Alkalicoccobacillus gibsonii TaxID=79881 RepID=UPI00351927EE
MHPTYLTTHDNRSHELIIQKSRFISHFKHTPSEAEAQDFILEIKKRHASANHNCSAYVIGENNDLQKANDDGEPSGTAGVPMLEVLKKRNVRNTTVVVTRYFGGIKLGAGGLIRAYGRSVSDGLDSVGMIQRLLVHEMTISFDYGWQGKMENELRNSSFQIKAFEYAENVQVTLYVEPSDLPAFKDWIINLTNAQAQIKEGTMTYLDLNYST